MKKSFSKHAQGMQAIDPQKLVEDHRHAENRSLRETQLAERWQVSRRTLQRWREKGNGPIWMQINGVILYRLEDIRAFEGQRRRARQP